MTVRIIEDKEIWDGFIDDNPHSIIFHKWDILKIIEINSHYKLLPYAIYDEKDNIIGVCPLFFKKRFGMRLVFSQPPGSGIPYIGLLLDKKFYVSSQHKKESYLNKVVNELHTVIMNYTPNFTSISLLPDVSDIREFGWNDYDIKIDYSYIIDIERDLDTIWGGFDKDCRREIRGSEKFNLSIQKTSDVEKFFSIMVNRYNDQKLSFPVFSSDYLKQLLTSAPGYFNCYFILNDDRIVNLVLTYNYQQRMVFWKGWVNLDKEIHSNEYLTWEFVKTAKEQGFKELEIQGGNVGRLSKFKSEFNPMLETFFEVSKKDSLGKMAERIYLDILRKSI